jgi:hypothetical protein
VDPLIRRLLSTLDADEATRVILGESDTRNSMTERTVMRIGGCQAALATNWLPDGQMLITGAELLRVEPDGSRVVADAPAPGVGWP